QRNEAWIVQNHLDCQPRELMAVIPYDCEPAAIRVPVTDWTTTVDRLREGDYCYDHIASATFDEGDGFNFNDFNKALGGVASIKALDAIRAFYRRIEEEADDPLTAEQMLRVSKATAYRNLIRNGVTQTVAASSLGVPRTTLNDWVRELGLDAENEPDEAGNGGVSVRQRDGIASSFDDGRTRGSRARTIYISKGRGEKGGSEDPVPSNGCLSEGVLEPPSEGVSDPCSDHSSDTPIPDGSYSFDELRRAVHHCIGDDGE
ncbi:MAG: hypothetical protein Q4P84_09085, partial [Elusimicrobiales bacterium]|nr:hypothetical protein [Elusimicrobiales bacterium]